MNILGVGPLEILFIIIIALVILGPKDIGRAGLSIGRWLRRIMTSETWRIIRGTSSELRNIPNRLIREAGLDELKDELPTEEELRQAMSMDEIEKVSQQVSADLSDWTSPAQTILPPGTSSPKPSSKQPSPTPKKQAFEEPPVSDWSTPRPSFQKPAESNDIEQSDSSPENRNSESVQTDNTTYPPPI
jgi:sec-independent protein translocase protein TatB